MAGALAPCQEKQYRREAALCPLQNPCGWRSFKVKRGRQGQGRQDLAREKTPMTMLSRRTLLAITLPAIAAGTARAEDAEDYPPRQVTFIVPFAPAGGTDILARLLGQKLEQRLNKSFVVENRPGAGTVIATNFVANSPPDGYTIAMTVSSLAIDVTLYKKLPYDVPKDLAMVALIASVPFVLVVSPSLPVTSV